MNRNVFGNPVTERTVGRLPGYNEPTRSDLAQVALEMFEADDKLGNARDYLNHLANTNWNVTSTKVLIYNATGETMTLMTDHDWSGQAVDSSPPNEIRNGQWGTFFHQQSLACQPGSRGAVVYRINLVDCMISWYNSQSLTNYCYAQIRNSGCFGDTDWEMIKSNMLCVSGNFCTIENHPVDVAIKIDNERISECIAFVRHRTMNRNVFGTPVTKRTLRELPTWPNHAPTNFELVTETLDMLNAEGKLGSARTYLNHLQDEYGQTFCTKHLIYNATGEIMTLISHTSGLGHFVHSAPPTEIHNGQWGVFFHRPWCGRSNDCSADVVYRFNSTDAKFMMSWGKNSKCQEPQKSYDAKIINNSSAEENRPFDVEIPID